MAAKEHVTPNLEFMEVLDRIVGNNPRPYIQAFNDFCTEAKLNPRPINIQAATEEQYALFNEWFIFDYEFKRGQTSLEWYVANPPKNVDAALMSSFRQAVATQISGRFWITGINKKTHFATLEDMSTDKTFEVYDKCLCNSIPGPYGILLTRLVYVDDCWYLPGNPIDYFPIQPTENMKQTMREAPNDDVTFMDLLRQHYAPKDKDATVMVPSKEPQKAKRQEAEFKDTYKRLYDEGRVPVSWAEMSAAISNHLHDMPTIALNEITGNGTSQAFEFADEEDLQAFVDAFMFDWNLIHGASR